jgi:hypothetical protein
MNQEDDARLNSIWAKQREETEYWLREWLDGCEAKNVSIHRTLLTGMEHTIIYDMDDKTAILIETDTAAPTAEESHKYMMIEEQVLEKLAGLFGLPNATRKP